MAHVHLNLVACWTITETLRTTPLDIVTFAHVAAHDLKAPMNGMASLVDFLREDYGEALGEQGREDLAMLQRLATRGVALVDALKVFTRVSTTPLTPVVLDMSLLVQRVLDGVAARAEGVTIAPGLTSSLPRALGDAELVATLVEQIVHNAILFRTEHACHVEVSHVEQASAPTVPAGHVIYAVHDRGLGIPPKHLEDVFVLFKRLHGPDKFGGGAGGGLAICRQIAARHGGALWAESVEGHGSTFFFTLPAAPDAGTAAAHR